MINDDKKPAPILNIPKEPLDLTKLLPKYTDVYVLQSVYCENCKTITAPNGIAWAVTIDEIDSMGEKLHSDGVRSKAVLCSTPLLLINYTEARLQAELVK